MSLPEVVHYETRSAYRAIFEYLNILEEQAKEWVGSNGA